MYRSYQGLIQGWANSEYLFLLSLLFNWLMTRIHTCAIWRSKPESGKTWLKYELGIQSHWYKEPPRKNRREEATDWATKRWDWALRTMYMGMTSTFFKHSQWPTNFNLSLSLLSGHLWFSFLCGCQLNLANLGKRFPYCMASFFTSKSRLIV